LQQIIPDELGDRNFPSSGPEQKCEFLSVDEILADDSLKVFKRAELAAVVSESDGRAVDEDELVQVFASLDRSPYLDDDQGNAS
jgi:hypothetical protein